MKGFREAPYFVNQHFKIQKIKKPTLIFSGTVKQAIQYFPQNINVAATLSLAGIGPEKTKVQIYTSPSYQFNQHEIQIESHYGKVECRVTNVPSRQNPKTSSLAIGSALATLAKILSPVKIGT